TRFSRDWSSDVCSSDLKATPRQARKFIVECIKAGLVPFLQGPPGIGKSVINHSISKDFNLQMIDHRLSTSEPTDLTGLPDFNNRSEERRVGKESISR